jgi:phosphoribosylanthranilate isomerase
MWIKICGMTTAEAVAAALEARADAIGFVFARSPRQISPAAAAALAAPARGRLSLVAVTHHPSQQLLEEIVAALRPDVLQTDVDDVPALRLPEGLRLLPVLRTGGNRPATLPARLLYEGPGSGTGVTCDWSAARDAARRTELILAGGLNADNVGAAIESVRPFGVDVSSGVEERPGIKSPEKVRQFVRIARAAFRSLRTTDEVNEEENR